MKHLKQQGSAHAVIIVVLVLALVGTLGFIFWQNFIQKDKEDASSTTQTTTPVAQVPAAETYTFNAAFGVGFSFSYPKDWTMERSLQGPIPLNTDAGYTQEIVTVTSPSKNVSVKYDIAARGGLGGACVSEEQGTISTISTSPLPSFAGGSYTEYSIKNTTGYQYYSGITSTAATVGTRVNDSACNVFMVSILKLGMEANGVVLMGANIHVKAFDDNNGLTKNTLKLSDIESSYKTDEYMQAKAILVSTVLTQ